MVQATGAVNRGRGDLVEVLVRESVELDQFRPFGDRHRTGDVLVDEFRAPNLQLFGPISVSCGTYVVVNETTDGDADQIHHVLPSLGRFVREAAINIRREINFVLHGIILSCLACIGEGILRLKKARANNSRKSEGPISRIGTCQIATLKRANFHGSRRRV